MNTTRNTMARMAGMAMAMLATTSAFGFSVQELLVQLESATAQLQQAQDGVDAIESTMDNLDAHMGRIHRALNVTKSPEARRALQEELRATHAQIEALYQDLSTAESRVSQAQAEVNRIRRSIDEANSDATR